MSSGPGLATAALHWAMERPADPAVVEGVAVLSWAALSGRAMAVMEVLLAAGAGPGARVALEPPTSTLGVVALHGIALAGVQAVLVPSRWTDAEVADLLATTRPVVRLHASARPGPDEVPTIDLRSLGVAAAATRPGAAATSRPGTELVVPTSGTTARPRLARLPVERIDASAAAWSAVLPSPTAWLLSLGLAHVAGLGIVARAARAGVPVVVPSSDMDLATALGCDAGAGPTADHPPVSHASIVATQLARVLDVTGVAPAPATLRAVLVGGGPIPPLLVERALVAGWPVWPSYGATETASGVAATDPEAARRHAWSAGVALPGVELRISASEVAAGPDPQAAAAAAPPAGVPPDSAGELQVRGPMVFDGYLDDAVATTSRRTPDGWLRTGDLATLDAHGRLRILGRLDDVIISGGENVAPAEVEAALAALPGVREVAVVGVPDDAWGSVPVAVIVPVVGDDPVDSALLAAAGDVLATFRRPARILRSAALPRGAADKLMRRSLRGPAAVAVAGPPPATPDRGPELELRTVLADDGQPLLVRAAPRRPDDGRPAVLILHATLSSSGQLLRLAGELAPHARVLLLDRRGSGGSRMAVASPVTIARHVEDAAQVLAANGEAAAFLVGHSFGGVVGLELAARRPDVVRGVVAWEPPYIPLAPLPEREHLARVATLVRRAHASGGPEGATRTFMAMVSPGAWERLRPDQQAALGAEGDGVLADAAMPDLDPDGLAAIRVPVVLGTGGSSDAFYAPTAEAIRERVPGARMRSLPGLRHHAPIVAAGSVAGLVRPLLDPHPDPHPVPTAQEPHR